MNFPDAGAKCSAALPKPEGSRAASLVPVLPDTAAIVTRAGLHPASAPAYLIASPAACPGPWATACARRGTSYAEWRDWKTKEVVARELYDNDQSNPLS